MPRRLSRIPLFALAAALPLVCGGNAAAESECSDAISAYNNAMQEAAYRSRRYGNCVGQSRATDDCYSEFRAVKNAHDDFENAVNKHRSECN